MKNACGVVQKYLVKCEYMYAVLNVGQIDAIHDYEVVHIYRVCDELGDLCNYQFYLNQQACIEFAKHNDLIILGTDQCIQLFGHSLYN